MLTQTLSAVAATLVAVGVLFQLVTLARVGARILRSRLARTRRESLTVRQPAKSPPAIATTAPRITRRRCRDYRTALRASGRCAPAAA
jgi:hypothetical protein